MCAIGYFRNMKVQLNSETQRTKAKEIKSYITNHVPHSFYLVQMFLSFGQRYEVEFRYFDSNLLLC